jgi:hypothetical protein
MTETRRKEMGNHLRASLMSQSRKVITYEGEGGECHRECEADHQREGERTLSRLAVTTHPTQTTDWIVKRRKFMLNCFPDTTNSAGKGLLAAALMRRGGRGGETRC